MIRKYRWWLTQVKNLIKVVHVISILQQWVILTHTCRLIQAKSHFHANFVTSVFQLEALIEGSFSRLWPWANGPRPQIVKLNSTSSIEKGHKSRHRWRRHRRQRCRRIHSRQWLHSTRTTNMDLTMPGLKIGDSNLWPVSNCARLWVSRGAVGSSFGALPKGPGFNSQHWHIIVWLLNAILYYILYAAETVWWGPSLFPLYIPCSQGILAWVAICVLYEW